MTIMVSRFFFSESLFGLFPTMWSTQTKSQLSGQWPTYEYMLTFIKVGLKWYFSWLNSQFTWCCTLTPFGASWFPLLWLEKVGQQLYGDGCGRSQLWLLKDRPRNCSYSQLSQGRPCAGRRPHTCHTQAAAWAWTAESATSKLFRRKISKKLVSQPWCAKWRKKLRKCNGSKYIQKIRESKVSQNCSDARLLKIHLATSMY